MQSALPLPAAAMASSGESSQAPAFGSKVKCVCTFSWRQKDVKAHGGGSVHRLSTLKPAAGDNRSPRAYLEHVLRGHLVKPGGNQQRAAAEAHLQAALDVPKEYRLHGWHFKDSDKKRGQNGRVTLVPGAQPLTRRMISGASPGAGAPMATAAGSGAQSMSRALEAGAARAGAASGSTDRGGQRRQRRGPPERQDIADTTSADIEGMSLCQLKHHTRELAKSLAQARKMARHVETTHEREAAVQEEQRQRLLAARQELRALSDRNLELAMSLEEAYQQVQARNDDLDRIAANSHVSLSWKVLMDPDSGSPWKQRVTDLTGMVSLEALQTTPSWSTGTWEAGLHQGS